MEEWTEVSTLGELLARAAGVHPDRDAIVFPEERRSYRELLDGARHVARGLWALGVRPGQNVAILMPNCMEFVEAFFGATLLGAVIVPLNARYRIAELGYVIENADAACVLTTDRVAEHVDFTGVLRGSLPSLGTAPDPANLELPEAPRLKCAAVLHGEDRPGFLGREGFDALAEQAPSLDDLRQHVRIRDVATILYTSGTTSHPKGCMLTHEAIVRTAAARVVERLVHADEERLWCPCPLFHVGAILPLIGCVTFADTFMTMTHFEPGPALEMIERERATTLWPLFPAFTNALIDHPDFARTDVSRVKQLPTVGAPENLRTVQRAFPQARVMNAFGMTETAAIITLPAHADTLEQRTDWCGQPFRGIELDVVDPDTGASLPPHTMGEIIVRGYCVLEGYYRDPQKTADSIDADGWFHTGDLGILDPDGRIMFRGRLKDMLKVGGENVAAVEIEAYIGDHPAVRHVEVVGIPDPRLDEVPVAFVELYDFGELTEDDVIAFCRDRIARYKVPRHVRFVQEWPMSATKVNKVALRERIGAELAAA
jgi:acyl-CoA synthetase (AMP-forming)/AMP-acid ligase II